MSSYYFFSCYKFHNISEFFDPCTSSSTAGVRRNDARTGTGLSIAAAIRTAAFECDEHFPASVADTQREEWTRVDLTEVPSDVVYSVPRNYRSGSVILLIGFILFLMILLLVSLGT